jgi:hypothetical protein
MVIFVKPGSKIGKLADIISEIRQGIQKAGASKR